MARDMRLFPRIFVLAASALVALALMPRGAAAQDAEQLLYSFCSQSNCLDGLDPVAGLIMDGAGNFYGTTRVGGIGCHFQGCGTAFRLTPGPTGMMETVLYSFCQRVSCADGRQPAAGLIVDGAGNLYGTTSSGGFYGGGIVFELTPDPTGTVWTEFVLYSFTGGADGSSPYAGLIMDAAGNLYGTTQGGGANNRGVVFELAPNAPQTVLYSFCAQPGCADGALPGALIMDGVGNLYGTTSSGGVSGNGVVFRLAPDGTETVLYSFCPQPGCADGAHPGGLVMDGAGNLYGTAGGGVSNNGVVFEVAPDGTQTVLYSFCPQPGCADGAEPTGGLIMDAAGNLYGTTVSGGTGLEVFGDGVAFELAPGGTETVLYSFCQQSSCFDGKSPAAGLIMDAAGNLYGTTQGGGAGPFGGTVFELTPPSAPSGHANGTLAYRPHE